MFETTYPQADRWPWVKRGAGVTERACPNNREGHVLDRHTRACRWCEGPRVGVIEGFAATMGKETLVCVRWLRPVRAPELEWIKIRALEVSRPHGDK